MNLRQVLCATAMTVAALALPLAAAGQSDPGATRIGGLVSGSIAAGHSATTVGVSASYRFAPRLAVEGDVSHFSNLKLAEVPLQGALTTWLARATSATANVAVELPSGLRWLRPYFSAGGGTARVRRDTRGLASCEPCAPRIYMKPVVSVGGGVDFLVWREVAVGVDMRYQRVFEDERLFRPNLRDLKRVGSFVSYRF